MPMRWKWIVPLLILWVSDGYRPAGAEHRHERWTALCADARGGQVHWHEAEYLSLSCWWCWHSGRDLWLAGSPAPYQAQPMQRLLLPCAHGAYGVLFPLRPIRAPPLCA